MRDLRKPEKKMGRVPKPDYSGHVGPVRRAPTPADYYDEVSDEQLKRIAETVHEAIEEEELEVVDGPAW
jgi:hypothetical protein